MTDTTEKLKRIDYDGALREKIIPHCRLGHGDVWVDSVSGHRVCVADASDVEAVTRLFDGARAALIVNDPPYNITVGGSASTGALSKTGLSDYIEFSKKWMTAASLIMTPDAALYIWLGMDVRDGLQPFPDFILMMREHFPQFIPRNVITMRNQRGFGTQKNWMWVRQELLYYIRGNPRFNIDAEYTDIPKILKGYYKKVGGEMTENTERGKSDCIRAGNVWVDVQQVFYRMQENVPGCYAQKPLKSIERIVSASSQPGDTIADFFSHSGTTLIAGERLGRRVFTIDLDPVYAEISIRRLENLRATGNAGFQWKNPFPELSNHDEFDFGDTNPPG